MIYKKEIGAHIEMRPEFLVRWKAATNSVPLQTLATPPVDATTVMKGDYLLCCCNVSGTTTVGK